jgi:FAD/FMN-containing dehydrogenase
MTIDDMLLLEKMSRRRFLALSALGTLSSVLVACQSGSQGPAGVTPTHLLSSPTSTPGSSPTAQPVPTEADWAALANSFQGTLVRPANSRYQTAYQLYNTRFDGIHPQAIAYCASPADVQLCLSFERKFGLPFAARGGGHSYAGYSTTTGFVIDVTRMNTIQVNANAGNAVVGAGARLIDVYAAVAQQGMVIPAGSCPTVGIAGVTLGGGIGVLGRKFGLTCDNLLAAQVVVADGSVLSCDANTNSDLFWALRGGGGGNFGVVTSFTFQMHPVSTLSLFTFDWPWSAAAEMVNAWQNWAPSAPDELWSNCLLLGTDRSSQPVARVNGVYVGDTGGLNALLRQLTASMSVAPSGTYVSASGVLDTMLIEAGCYGKTVSECHLVGQTPDGQEQRDTYSAKSDFYTRALPRQGIDNLVNAINLRQTSATMSGGGILLDAAGGAINRVAADATAFVHRDALFSAQYLAHWNASDPASVVTANYGWMADTWQSMRPYASGGAYQNYIDPNLADWQNAYYGANLPRLQRVKATYDPGNLFHFAQSIPALT